MKKQRPSSPVKSRGGSKSGSSFGKSPRSKGAVSGGKKPLFSSGRPKRKPDGREKIFMKPSRDPGRKIRGESGGVPEDHPAEETAGGGVQQALQSSGCGCCSSISGLIWLFVMGVVAVVVILALKCGGC